MSRKYIRIPCFAKIFLVLLGTSFALEAHAQDRTVIRFGVDPTFPPYESLNKKNEMEGIDIDTGEAICQHLEVECDWVKINFDGAIPALQAEKIDAILSGLTVTERRKKSVLFSSLLYFSPSQMMVPAGVILNTTASSLKGKSVGIVQGSTQADYANKHWRGEGVNLINYENDNSARQDLILGRIDATLQDRAAAQSFFESSGGQNFHMTGDLIDDPEVFGEGVAIGMRLEDSELKEAIDSAISSIKENGTFQEILDRYTEYGLIDSND